MTASAHRKVEVLVDRPLLDRVLDIAERIGIAGYTIIPTLSGRGEGGRWFDDEMSGATVKVMVYAIMREDTARSFLEALAPLLDSHSIIVASGEVEVIRAGKFA